MSDARGSTLGQRIAKARLAKGWKQKHLAAAVEVEPVTISRWETDAHSPSLDRLYLIAAALGVAVDELLPEANEVVPA